MYLSEVSLAQKKAVEMKKQVNLNFLCLGLMKRWIGIEKYTIISRQKEVR